MSLYQSGYTNLTPVALMNLATSIGQGANQGYAAGAGMALRNYQAQSLDAFRQGQNDARLAAAAARRYAADRGLEGKIAPAELDARSKLAGDFITHAADLGKQFDPGTVQAIYDQAFTRPLQDLFQAGIDPTWRPAATSGVSPSTANIAASLGQAPPPAAPAAGAGSAQSMVTPPAAAAPSAPNFTPPPAAATPSFAPSPAVQAGTAKDVAAAANLNASALKTTADVTGPLAFFAAVSKQPQAQQRQFVQAWNATHGTNYPMPGDRRPSGQTQPFYDQDVELQDQLRRTDAQINSLNAGAARSNAQATAIPLDSAARRVYEDRLGRAAETNAAANTTRSTADVMNANTNAYRATHPASDSFTANATKRLDALDVSIGDANKRKNTAISNPKLTPAQKGAITRAEDANINAFLAEQRQIRASLNDHQAAGPASGTGAVGSPSVPSRAAVPPRSSFQSPPAKSKGGLETIARSANGKDVLQYDPATGRYLVNGRPTGHFVKRKK